MQDHSIPLSVPCIRGNELKYVTEAIQAEWVSTSGGDISLFERDMAAYLEMDRACAVQSGTAGLHLCLRHFGIGSDDIVLVPTLTFIATINPVIYQHATPVFFDCDEHLCLNVPQIEHYLQHDCAFDGQKTWDKETDKQVKAVIPVHVFGDYTDMEALMALADKYRLWVIEDATESLGTRISEGRFRGKFTGTIGHAGVFSFNGNKIITTGGGGMIVSPDANALDHMRYLSQQAKDDPVYFINNEVGYNYRMTNLQAAMGRAQLEQLDNFIRIKKENYLHYTFRLEEAGYSLVKFRADEQANFWFYSLLTGSEEPKVRDQLISFLAANHIQTRPIWKLNHLQKPFLEYKSLPCPHAEHFYAQVVNLPCSSNLTYEEIEYVCEAISQFASRG